MHPGLAAKGLRTPAAVVHFYAEAMPGRTPWLPVLVTSMGLRLRAGKGSSSGVGFAIPVDQVKGLVQQILQFGKVRHCHAETISQFNG